MQNKHQLRFFSSLALAAALILAPYSNVKAAPPGGGDATDFNSCASRSTLTQSSSTTYYNNLFWKPYYDGLQNYTVKVTLSPYCWNYNLFLTKQYDGGGTQDVYQDYGPGAGGFSVSESTQDQSFYNPDHVTYYLGTSDVPGNGTLLTMTHYFHQPFASIDGTDSNTYMDVTYGVNHCNSASDLNIQSGTTTYDFINLVDGSDNMYQVASNQNSWSYDGSRCYWQLRLDLKSGYSGSCGQCGIPSTGYKVVSYLASGSSFNTTYMGPANYANAPVLNLNHYGNVIIWNPNSIRYQVTNSGGSCSDSDCSTAYFRTNASITTTALYGTVSPSLIGMGPVSRFFAKIFGRAEADSASQGIGPGQVARFGIDWDNTCTINVHVHGNPSNDDSTNPATVSSSWSYSGPAGNSGTSTGSWTVPTGNYIFNYGGGGATISGTAGTAPSVSSSQTCNHNGTLDFTITAKTNAQLRLQ